MHSPTVVSADIYQPKIPALFRAPALPGKRVPVVPSDFACIIESSAIAQPALYWEPPRAVLEYTCIYFRWRPLPLGLNS